MVKSMTGYGRGERSFEDGVQVTVELRSVNNRYLDCAVKLPRAYIFAEDAIKTRVQAAVGQGDGAQHPRVGVEGGFDGGFNVPGEDDGPAHVHGKQFMPPVRQGSGDEALEVQDLL